MIRCHGPCEQGRKPCPTPDACELREEDGSNELFYIFVIAVTFVSIMALLAFVVSR
jgi:hypothetical protein